MNDEPWHLSKSFNLSQVLAIGAQTVALIWFFAMLDSGVKNNREMNIKQDAKIESLEKIVQNQAVTMARMDENIKAIRDAIETMMRSRGQ
jgi:type VI protein secretion system component VasK